MRYRLLCMTLAMLLFTAASGFADTVTYSFEGLGEPFADLSAEPVAFTLTVPYFVNPPLNSGFLGFTCAQLTSSTNAACAVVDAVYFSNQSGGIAGADLQFDAANNAGYVFFFGPGAFGTSGVFQSEGSGPEYNVGTLTVTDDIPEPPAVVLLLMAGALALLGFRILIAHRARRMFR